MLCRQGKRAMCGKVPSRSWMRRDLAYSAGSALGKIYRDLHSTSPLPRSSEQRSDLGLRAICRGSDARAQHGR
jgi:hypothetical protein